MNKWTQTMVGFAMMGILAVALAGCGQAPIDQGEVDTTPPDMEKLQKEMDAKTKEAQDAEKKNKGKGGGGAPGGPPPNN